MDVDVPEDHIQQLLKSSDGASDADTIFDVGDCEEVLAALKAYKFFEKKKKTGMNTALLTVSSKSRIDCKERHKMTKKHVSASHSGLYRQSIDIYRAEVEPEPQRCRASTLSRQKNLKT